MPDDKVYGVVQVILNADDFGRSQSINAAVMRAHREGVLTSASLMVTGDAVGQAVTLAREAPALAVGLHVVVAAGRASSPARQIPHIVDRDGRFPTSPLIAGLRYAFSPKAQEELGRELEAQFEQFASTGLPLSHVDGHLHMHVHPTVLKLLLPLAERYGARGIRMPRDDLWLALRFDRRRVGVKATWAAVFGLLDQWARRRVRTHALVTAHRIYGLMQTGDMQEAYVVEVLRRLQGPSAELYFHPSTEALEEPMGPNPGDLATLLSPAVRQIVRQHGLVLSTYASLSGG